MRNAISRHDPDIICIAEGHPDFLAGFGGHLIDASPDYGYPLKPGRRKVILWSRQPWSAIDRLGAPELPSGRFVAGMTETPDGPLRCIGVCVPWDLAHVRGGRRNRRSWEDHITYLRALAPILTRPEHGAGTIVLGDFNQSIPPQRAPIAAFAALDAAILRNFRVATAGSLAPLGRAVVDHLAHTPDFMVAHVETIPNRDGDVPRWSDHPGLRIDLRRAPP